MQVTEQKDPRIFYLAKSLRGMGLSMLLILSSFRILGAQEVPAPADAPNAEPLPGSPAAANNAGNPNNSGNTDNTGGALGTSPDSGDVNSSTPYNPSTLYTPAGLYSPLLPQTAPNSLSGNQAPQLTTPSLFLTGSNDVSQIATRNALSQAFSEDSALGFYSESGMDYSHGPFGLILLGPLTLRTTLSTSIVSDDNLRISDQSSGPFGTGGQKQSDTSYTITPAAMFEYGNREGQKGYASLTYAPTFVHFFHYSTQNANNQNVAFNVQYPFQRLTLSASEAYTQTSGTNTESNSRTTETSEVSTVGGNYAFDDKIDLSSHFQYATSTFSQGVGLNDTTASINTSLNYHLSAKLTVSPSVNVGEDTPQETGRENYQQALLGVSYVPTAKISLSAQGGAEFRQYEQASGGTSSPIFAVGLGYTPFDSTTINLSAFQNQQPSSFLLNQTVINTGVGVAATQRFFQRFFLNFTFNYSHSDYESNSQAAGDVGNLTQDQLTYRPSISYSPTTWTAVTVYYQYEDNKSNEADQSYHDNQMGVSISAQF
jgi:hypothetical protein